MSSAIDRFDLTNPTVDTDGSEDEDDYTIDGYGQETSIEVVLSADGSSHTVHEIKSRKQVRRTSTISGSFEQKHAVKDKSATNNQSVDAHLAIKSKGSKAKPKKTGEGGLTDGKGDAFQRTPSSEVKRLTSTSTRSPSLTPTSSPMHSRMSSLSPTPSRVRSKSRIKAPHALGPPSRKVTFRMSTDVQEFDVEEEEGQEQTKQQVSVKTEEHGTSWIIDKLWMGPGEQHCRVRIPDSIVVQRGKMVKWLFTSKDGEVLKKNFDKMQDNNGILNRFLDASFGTCGSLRSAANKVGRVLSDEADDITATTRKRNRKKDSEVNEVKDLSNFFSQRTASLSVDEETSITNSKSESLALESPVCLIYYTPKRDSGNLHSHDDNSGTYVEGKVVPFDKKAFQGLLSHRAAALPPVQMIQAFVYSKGKDKSWYRNHYHRMGDGRVNRVTYKMTTLGDPSGSETMIICKDTAFTKILDNTTSKVISYIEDNVRKQILSLKGSYVVDEKQQIWFVGGKITLRDGTKYKKPSRVLPSIQAAPTSRKFRLMREKSRREMENAKYSEEEEGPQSSHPNRPTIAVTTPNTTDTRQSPHGHVSMSDLLAYEETTTALPNIADFTKFKCPGDYCSTSGLEEVWYQFLIRIEKMVKEGKIKPSSPLLSPTHRNRRAGWSLTASVPFDTIPRGGLALLESLLGTACMSGMVRRAKKVRRRNSLYQLHAAAKTEHLKDPVSVDEDSVSGKATLYKSILLDRVEQSGALTTFSECPATFQIKLLQNHTKRFVLNQVYEMVHVCDNCHRMYASIDALRSGSSQWLKTFEAMGERHADEILADGEGDRALLTETEMTALATSEQSEDATDPSMGDDYVELDETEYENHDGISREEL